MYVTLDLKKTPDKKKSKFHSWEHLTGPGLIGPVGLINDIHLAPKTNKFLSHAAYV